MSSPLNSSIFYVSTREQFGDVRKRKQDMCTNVQKAARIPINAIKLCVNFPNINQIQEESTYKMAHKNAQLFMIGYCCGWGFTNQTV
jgi:hypothetical protein